MQDFTKLLVWQKAHAVSLEITRAARTLRGRDFSALRGQLQRSAQSIPAQIVEGAGKTSRAEFARYLDIALGSAAETQHHLIVARDLDALPARDVELLSSGVTEVRRMLFGLQRRVRGELHPTG